MVSGHTYWTVQLKEHQNSLKQGRLSGNPNTRLIPWNNGSITSRWFKGTLFKQNWVLISPTQKDDRIRETKVDWQVYRVLDRSLGILIIRGDKMIQNHLYLPSSAWTNYSLFPRKQPPLAPKWWTPNQELKPLSLEFEMFLITILFLFSISLNPAPILRNSFLILFLWVVRLEWVGGGGRRRYNANLYPKLHANGTYR